MELSPLQGLAPELRNRIYEYGLTETTVVHLDQVDIPLARTCRQVREECLQLYYHINTFRITVPFQQALKLTTTLKRVLGATLTLIPKLEVKYERILIHRYGGEAENDNFAARQLSKLLLIASFEEEDVVWEAIAVEGLGVEHARAQQMLAVMNLSGQQEMLAGVWKQEAGRKKQMAR